MAAIAEYTPVYNCGTIEHTLIMLVATIHDIQLMIEPRLLLFGTWYLSI